MRWWPPHDRQLTTAAQQARAAARHARESLRWNPRARTEKAVRQPDGAVLDSLDILTARTRAIARSLPDLQDIEGAGQDRASSFGEEDATLLRDLASPVRQLADLRSSRPRDALVAVSRSQHHLERQADRASWRLSQSGNSPVTYGHHEAFCQPVFLVVTASRTRSAPGAGRSAGWTGS